VSDIETQQMNVYRVECLLVDFEDFGPEAIRVEIENARYPNHWIGPSVISMQAVSVDWHERHPLNMGNQRDAEFRRLFPDQAADLSASRAECELLREALRKTKTCNLNTEVRELVNSVLRPTIDQARKETK